MTVICDKIRFQEEVCHLFKETYTDQSPITQSTVSRIAQKFEELKYADEEQINVL